MDELIVWLKKTKLFCDTEHQTVASAVLPHGQRKSVCKGEFLIAPQERLDSFAVILSGRIHILHLFSDGSSSLMSVLEPGDLFGADLVCTRSRISPYHAVAAEPTQLLFFPAALLHHGCLPETERVMLRDRLLTMIADENMKKEYRLAILSRKGLRERIWAYLTMQASKRGTNSFVIPFSREDLASFLCVNRSALSHELSQMAQEGLISFHKNHFTLHKTASG